MLTARKASTSSDISTNPYPFRRPFRRSVFMITDWIGVYVMFRQRLKKAEEG